MEENTNKYCIECGHYYDMNYSREEIKCPCKCHRQIYITYTLNYCMVSETYDGVMNTIKWKKLKVPVKKNPFPEDEKW